MNEEHHSSQSPHPAITYDEAGDAYAGNGQEIIYDEEAPPPSPIRIHNHHLLQVSITQ